MDFKKYRRKQIAELRDVTGDDIYLFKKDGKISFAKTSTKGLIGTVSVSEQDKNNGSPKIGDMIARNPKNHDDQWLVAEKYYKDNFELVD